MAVVSHLYRYPVKGLSAEALSGVDLEEGAGFPLDRRFALALTEAGREGGWRPKSHFATLMTQERLAALESSYEPEGGVLTIRRGGKIVARGALATPVGRATIEQFFRAYLKATATAAPRIVGANEGEMLSDQREPLVSIVGVGSVADIERVVGRAVDPLRFRANVYLGGSEPWAEMAWIGREITLGTARLRVTARIGRCAATEVDPATGIRDLMVVRSLQCGFGHTDCGVFATVIGSGRVKLGDPVLPAAS